MTRIPEEIRLTVVKLTQELLFYEERDRSSITPAFIAEKIDQVVAIQPRWGEGLDREWVIDELNRRFCFWNENTTPRMAKTGYQLIAAVTRVRYSQRPL
jgi:hypothetical protein